MLLDLDDELLGLDSLLMLFDLVLLGSQFLDALLNQPSVLLVASQLCFEFLLLVCGRLVFPG